MPADSLRDVQRRFWELVTAPEDVPKTLAARGISVEELARTIRGDGRLSAAERLDIYANMYFFRIRDVLREEYPKLLALVGEAAFHNLATDFLAAHPPADFSLRNVGRALPAFLQSHALAGRWPFAGDLARLERERIEVFDAADAALLGVEELRARAPETFASLPLRLIPAHAIFAARFAVDELWRALDGAQPEPHDDAQPEPHDDAQPEPHDDAPAEPPAPAARDLTFIVWRQEPLVYHRPLDDDERALVPLLADGVSFGVVCERLAERHAGEDVAPIAFQLLARWVQDGWLLREEEEEEED